jgi:hypothetical protein
MSDSKLAQGMLVGRELIRTGVQFCGTDMELLQASVAGAMLTLIATAEDPESALQKVIACLANNRPLVMRLHAAIYAEMVRLGVNPLASPENMS